MKTSIFAGLALLYSVVPAAYSEVDFWEVTKAELYNQGADHTVPDSAVNWVLYAGVETVDPGDATSIVLEGGNISGSYAFEQDGAYWELLVEYPSAAAMDAELPGEDDYRLILTGAGGSVTQEFSFGENNFPEIPFLIGEGFSQAAELDRADPLELYWNEPGFGTAMTVQINEGSLLEGDEFFYEEVAENHIGSWDLGQGLTNEFYTGAVEFVSGTNYFGSGFSADGEITFNRLTQFPVQWVNHAVQGDDFNDNTVDTGTWQQLFADPGQLLSETNGQLEWDSDSGSDGTVVWKWNAGNLSTTQDWAVALDVNCLVDSASMTNREFWFGLALLADGGVDGLMTMEYLLDEWGAEVKTYVTTNETDVIEAEENHDFEKLSFKLSYDSKAGVLSSAYSSGGDYIVQTNVSIDAFSSVVSDDFSPAIFFGGEDIPEIAGQVFVDNFRIYEGQTLSNHVERVEIGYTKAFGTPGALDDEQIYDIEVLTGYGVTSVRLESSAGDVVEEFEQEFADAGAVEWDFEASDPMSEPYNSARDGEWLVTFGLNNGTFVSTYIPFLQQNFAPIPDIGTAPEFTVPVDLHGSVTAASAIDVEWSEPNSNAVLMGLEVATEDDDEEFLYYDSLDDAVGLAPPSAGPFSTRAQNSVPLEEGENELLIYNGWVRTGFNEDNVAFVVGKYAESMAVVIRADASDADADLLPDAWEIQYFGSTNALNGGPYEDHDGDASGNLDEYIAGTNPTNEASFFKITQTEADPYSLTIQWPSVEGREYEVYWKPSLTNSSVESLGTVQGPQSEFTDWSKIYDEPQGFYLIHVRLAE
ncbi:hypothetical protein [Pontiella agarivorans]|uniref:Uncharacterized protein n=1 Tax=Pontiella agarivorans TaxID=3038953 RepID=A0ABU5MWR5_9BACT|nr:hypothetical protein [Pontiella agarivorans]MDZ8118659.1 hypothetical protein [Pontiella agarivorans]